MTPIGPLRKCDGARLSSPTNSHVRPADRARAPARTTALRSTCGHSISLRSARTSELECTDRSPLLPLAQPARPSPEMKHFIRGYTFVRHERTEKLTGS